MTLTRIAVFMISALFWMSCSQPVSAGSDASKSSSASSSSSSTGPITLSIIHLNDTHAYLEPSVLNLQILSNGEPKTKALAGGFPKIVARIKQIRASKNYPLFLYAGDFFTGTLYYNEGKGVPDAAMLRLAGLDAACLGNHEFDYGPSVLSSWLQNGLQTTPILCANADFSLEPYLSNKIRPYLVTNIAGRKVGIIGLITPDVPQTSSPGPNIVFSIPALVQPVIDSLTAQGVRIIILLDHTGYDVDRSLALSLSNVSLIVGGHSHTLLGDFTPYGIPFTALYPTVVTNNGRPVLVLQSWEFGKILGEADVTFDASGAVTSFTASPQMLLSDVFYRVTNGSATNYTESELSNIRQLISASPNLTVIAPDLDASNILAPYTEKINNLKSSNVANAVDTLYNVRMPYMTNSAGGIMTNGSFIAPIAADAFLWKLSQNGKAADVALVDGGTIRAEFLQGNIKVSQIYDLLPFNNSLIVLTLSGAELKQTLEDGVKGTAAAFPYASGIRYTVTASNAANEKITRLDFWTNNSWEPVLSNQVFNLVTFAFLATGGDGYTTLKNCTNRRDTGFYDAPSFLEYAQAVTNLSVSGTNRVEYLP